MWFFIADWFAIYLVSRGFRPEDSLLAFWAPFLAADIGNFAGGGHFQLADRAGLVHRPVAPTVARGLRHRNEHAGLNRLLPFLRGPGDLFRRGDALLRGFSTIVLALPADLYRTGSVASVSGLSGTGAGIGTIAATYLTGLVSDKYSFEPILIVASLIPLLATAAVVLIIRNGKATNEGFINPI